MPGPKSEGERLLAAYFRQRRIPAEHEADVGGRSPDFLTSGDAWANLAFEVYEPRFRLPGRVGAFDNVPALQHAFSGRKRKQIAAIKEAGLPYVAVVGAAASDVPIDPLIMSGAMFGRVGFSMQLGADGEAAGYGALVFGSGGRLQPRQFRGVSAVAILRRFNPTLARLQRAFDSIADRGGPNAWRKGRREQGQLFEARQSLEAEMISAGTFVPDAALARLIILHNPFADRPLPSGFGGPHDTQWNLLVDEREARYEVVAEGVRQREVPSGST